MSRQIDLTKPLSEDDRRYLESRDWQSALDINAMNLMGGGADEAEVDEAEQGEGPYSGWHKSDWAAEIERRNADRSDEDKIDVGDGKVGDLKQAVLADDEARK